MAYFIKLTHSYSSKNRLQEAALKVARSLDDHQLESPEELKRFVEDRIMRLNRSLNRCTALNVSLKKSHRQKDYLLYVSDLFTLTLYEIQGQFDSQPSDSLQLPGFTNCMAAGPQLDLFSGKNITSVERHGNN